MDVYVTVGVRVLVLVGVCVGVLVGVCVSVVVKVGLIIGVFETNNGVNSKLNT